MFGSTILDDFLKGKSFLGLKPTICPCGDSLRFFLFTLAVSCVTELLFVVLWHSTSTSPVL
jgi:hypothetical protein